MKTNRLLRAALCLWLAAAASTALWPAMGAYYAETEGDAQARVAQWAPFAAIDPALEDGTALRLNMKESAASRTTTLTLFNDSETSAFYVFSADVKTVKPAGEQTAAQAKSAFLAALLGTLNDLNVPYNNGVTLAPGETISLQMELPNVTFTGLVMECTATQID